MGLGKRLSFALLPYALYLDVNGFVSKMECLSFCLQCHMNALGEHEELVKVLSELHSVSVFVLFLEHYR